MGCCIKPTNIIEKNKKSIYNKNFDIESLQNNEFSYMISQKETKFTKEKEKSSIKENIKDDLNEYEIPLHLENKNKNSSLISNNGNINKNDKKEKLEIVREITNEISNRQKKRSRNLSENKDNNNNISSSTEKINSMKCEENYNKKTKQMIRFLSYKNNINKY
jgi:hypothetical protein